MAKKIVITGELECKTVEGKLADASQIKDNGMFNMSQAEINADFDRRIINSVLPNVDTTTNDKNITIELNNGVNKKNATIPAATTTTTGVMSAEDKKQLYSTKPYTSVYNSSSLSNGYVDGNADTYTETTTTALKYMAVSVEEGMKCTLTSVRRNNGYMYIIYNANDEKIADFAGANSTVLTQEFTIPKGGVKLAVNCDALYLDSFALSIVKSTLLSRVVALETESVNVDEKIAGIDNKILDVQKQTESIEQDIFNYNSSSLSNGYVDGNADTYTETATTVIKYMAVSVEEGMKCTLTSVRRNDGYMYIIYNANDEKIADFAGANSTVLTQEFTIPKGGVKLAVNCDALYLDSFALSIVGLPTLFSRVVALETESVNIDERITEIDSKILDVQRQVASTEQDIFNYNSSSLSNGYVDGNANTYPGVTSTTAVKCMTLAVQEGMQCTLTSVCKNLGYMYIIYNANDERITYFTGKNATVITQEFTIPEGGVKLAVNCDSAYLNSFALSIVDSPTLLSRVIELEKENVEFDVLSAKNRIVYTLGSSTIDLMKTTTNADGIKDWTYLGQLLSAKKLYNIAIGGSTWQTQGIDTDTPDINITATRSASNQIKMLKRLVDSGKYEYPEIIFLQFTNGYSVSGTITDNMEQVMAMSFDELEANANMRLTFYGGVRYALELLNRYFPKATYYVSDGIQCDRDLPYRRGYEYVKSGRDALKKMCDRYSCPFLETSRSIGIVDLYEHGSKTSTSNIEIFTGATATGTIVLSLKDNDIEVSVTAGDTANVVAQKIANAVNSSNTGWTAQLNGSKVLLSVAKESAAVPEFNAASTGVSVDITFNQFADDYDGIYLSTDGLHPNEKGKQLIARCVAKGILETYFEKQ